MTSRYDDFDPGVRLYRKKCQEIHAQKLQSVKNVLNITGQQERIESQILSFRTQRKRNNDFQIKTRTTTLMQENQKLVQKIEGIHFRAPQYKAATATSKDSSLSRQRERRNSASQKQGSLNFVYRKNENQRIYRENLIMFEKLKTSKPNLRKSDFDDHFSQHKRYQATVSKSNQIEQNLLSQTQPRPMRSPSGAKHNNYLSSQRSSATLPPILDIRTPRKSVPTSHTPKIQSSSFMHNSERVLAKIRSSRPSLPAQSRASMEQKPLELTEKALPDIATHREMLQKTPIGGPGTTTGGKVSMMDIKQQSQTTMSNPYVSQKLRNSALKISSTQIVSPISSQIQASSYQQAGLPVRENSEIRRRRKKSKRSRAVLNLNSSRETSTSKNQVSFNLSLHPQQPPSRQQHQQNASKKKTKSKKSNKQVQVVEVQGIEAPLPPAGSSLTAPYSRANSCYHTQERSDQASPIAVRSQINTKESTHRNQQNNTTTQRSKSQLKKIDSAARLMLDTELQPNDMVVADQGTVRTSRDQASKQATSSTISLRKDTESVRAPSKKSSLSLKKSINSKGAQRQQSTLSLRKEDIAVRLAGSSSKRASAMSVNKKRQSALSIQKSQQSAKGAQSAEQVAIDQLIETKLDELWAQYDAETDQDGIERESLRSLLQEAIKQIFGRDEPLTDEVLDGVFAQFDAGKTSKITKAKTITFLQYLSMAKE